MEIEAKQEHVIRCIKLGMDLDTSMYCAECTEDEMSQLRADKDFTYKVKCLQSIEECNLLETHTLAMKAAAYKGNATPIQWKLAHMNKARWGNDTKGISDNDMSGEVVTYELPDNNRDGEKA